MSRDQNRVTTTGGVIYLRPEHLTKLKTLDELWEWLKANIFTEAST